MAFWRREYTLSLKKRGKIRPPLRIPEYMVTLFVPIGLIIAAVEYIMTIFKNFAEKEVYLSIQKEDGYEDEIAPHRFPTQSESSE